MNENESKPETESEDESTLRTDVIHLPDGQDRETGEELVRVLEQIILRRAGVEPGEKQACPGCMLKTLQNGILTLALDRNLKLTKVFGTVAKDFDRMARKARQLEDPMNTILSAIGAVVAEMAEADKDTADENKGQSPSA